MLLASGMWTVEELKKVAGLNFVRVFQEVEKVGKILRWLLAFQQHSRII